MAVPFNSPRGNPLMHSAEYLQMTKRYSVVINLSKTKRRLEEEEKKEMEEHSLNQISNKKRINH